MNQAIQTDYTTREYNNPVKWDGIKQGMIYPNSFFNLVTQKTNSITETETVSQTEAVSLESMLKAKYPRLVYHVFDASSGYWRTRNDYPHYLLYQEGDKAKETLENWKPSGPNPFYGSIDGQFIAPKEIRALGNVPPGSKAVVIHPKVQERMEQEPEYAKEIFQRIDTWFAFDIARNEAIRPGCTGDMAQAVAIGEDGSIVNAAASTPGGEITFSKSGSDTIDWWELRKIRHAYFMGLLTKAQMQRALAQAQQAQTGGSSLSNLLAGQGLQTAKNHLAVMMETTDLKTILGETIGGTSIDTILENTRKEVWDSGSFFL